MANKKQYYGLDEIGFVGTQELKSDARIKKDIEMTIQYVKTKKQGNRKQSSVKKEGSLVKVR